MSNKNLILQISLKLTKILYILYLFRVYNLYIQELRVDNI